MRKSLDELIKPNNENRIKISFIVTGIIGVLSNYIKLAIGTAEENIKILTDLTYSNLRHLSYSK